MRAQQRIFPARFFGRMGPGEYVFRVDGEAFIAVRNEAGFTGRNWDLHRHGGDSYVADQLGSRTECVERAEAIMQRERAIRERGL